MPFNDLGEWKPRNKKQEVYLSLPYTVREAMFGGGAGSGKSELLLMYGIVHGFHENSQFKQLFLRRTYGELKNEVVGRSREMYLRLGATYNKTDMVWTFPRTDQFGGTGRTNEGAEIWFGHCESEDDVHRYDSMQINLFTPDELTSFTEYIYTYIALTRVRSATEKLPAITRATGMPGDIGHNWVKKRFPKAARPGTIIVGKGGNKRIYIHSTAKDNDKIDPSYIQGLQGLNESERRAKEDGDWDSYEGTVFDELRERKIPEEPANALHVIEPFEVPVHWPRIVAIDWGFAAQTSIGFAAISPQKRVYIYRHFTFQREKIEEWAPKITPFIKSDEPNTVGICHSANQHRGDPHTIMEQVSSAIGLPCSMGPKDRVGGKLLIHEYLRWKPKEEIPFDEQRPYDEQLAQWIKRNRSQEEYMLYLRSFSPLEQETNLPKLLFFNDEAKQIKKITDALKQCKYEKDSKDGKKAEDVAEFSGDDPYDMIRILLHFVDAYFEQSKDAQERIEKIDSVRERFNISGDITGYYIQMRKLETEQAAEFSPVKRFHRGRR